MTHWLKMIGASDLPLPNDPFVRRPSLREQVRFPRDQFPDGMRAGDELLYYAVGGYKKVFAAARLDEDPRRDVPGAEASILARWPHAAAIKLGPHLDYVEFAPDLVDVDPALQRKIHQGVSHFQITPLQYQQGVQAIIAARDASRHKRPTSSPGH